MGDSTGASIIFGATGGVIEAAVRTAYEWITNEPLEKIDFPELRGLSGIREATVKVGDMDIKIGIANGLGNARKLLEKVRSGEVQYHAIEIMACPGGCINGGGQPFHGHDWKVVEQRAAAIYKEDIKTPLRKSHENPQIIKLYEEFLGEPGSDKAHQLLHTHYTAREWN